MMGNFERYELQESKKYFFGKIPSTWKIKRIKYLFNEINDRVENEELELLSVSQYTGVTIKKESLKDGDFLTNARSLSGYKKVEKGDLVSNIMLAWNGSLGVSNYQGITSPAYGVYRLKTDDNPNYFHYLFRTASYKNEFKRNSTGVIESRLRLYTDSFFKISAPVPPVEEQNLIVSFLDQKTQQIDHFIQLKEKMIALLEERKSAIINQAVTKGLDPDVPMKDSGIEWLGEIPEHWEVKKLKYLVDKISGGITPSMETLVYWNGKIPWLSSKDMKFDRISKSQMHITNLALKKTNINLLPVGTLLLVVRSGILQRKLPVSITDIPVTINQDLKALIINDDIESEYLFRLLKGCEKPILFSCVKAVATVESIEMEYFKNFELPIPPIEEQRDVCTYIDSSMKKIDKTLNDIQTQITLIKEYRASLISAAVTGKIKVSE